jgi:hypothetical protein
MKNLFLSFKGKLENLYLAGVYDIESIPLVSFLEDEPSLFKGQLKGDGLYLFQMGY